MSVKFIGILVFMIIGGLFTGTVYPADIKIGSVDMQRVINECSAGNEARKVIAQDGEKFQRLIAEKQRELQTMKESFEKQALMLTPDARANEEREYQNKLREFQRWGEDTQNELNQKRTQMEQNISIGLIKVVQEIGANEGYTFILQKNENIVLFASKPTDITDQVIKAYDVQKK
jgi:outer membrane protein